MTNTERIQANNAELREAIELAESLPDVPSKTENWTFTLESGETVTKAVYIG